MFLRQSVLFEKTKGAESFLSKGPRQLNDTNFLYIYYTAKTINLQICALQEALCTLYGFIVFLSCVGNDI